MTVDLHSLTDPVVRAAIEALQSGDRAAWTALFAPDAQLFDDGSPRPLAAFTKDALGHERFASIDRIEEGGRRLVGRFHTEQWGDFTTYFHFHIGPGGKIDRLDIGQA